MNDIQFEPIIGLEIHVELKTKSKMFCGCPADWFGKPPNSVTCPVCLGLPGALPVANKRAIEWCIMLGLTLNCEIPLVSKFDRKNYFYPDLPKGYQISQYDQPLAVNGWLDINNSINQSTNQPINQLSNKKIRIRRVHMEEDTGKLIHAPVDGQNATLVDFNRSGVPLVEIVTEPDIRGSEEARIFLKKLHQIIRYLDISDADMEKGSMRLEPNISVRETQNSKLKTQNLNAKVKSDKPTTCNLQPTTNDDLPSYKVEVKNINSFNFVKKAIDYEINRHTGILAMGEIPKQETRGWDEKKAATYSQRSKEEAHDYRYFPEPDIPPMRWSSDQLSEIRGRLPELPDKKIERFIKSYGLSLYDAAILIDEKETAGYFEKVVSCKLLVVGKSEEEITPKTIANWIINKKVDIMKTLPQELLKAITQKQRVVSMDEKELNEVVQKIIDKNPKAVADYRSGKENALMFLLGDVMRETRGKADSKVVRQKLMELLQ